MIGRLSLGQDQLFYEFRIEEHVPEKHVLRALHRFLGFSQIRKHLAQYYSNIGRPSIDSELMIRMLLVGYCFGIRAKRRLCEEVHLNLAYRWFCRLGLEDQVPEHSAFSKHRQGRYRDCELFWFVFASLVRRCVDEGLVGGEGFAVDARLN
jgi:transposase